MSAHTPESTTSSGSSDAQPYPAERAYGARHSTPAWKRITPDLSGGYVEIHLALDCDRSAVSPEEVTSS